MGRVPQEVFMLSVCEMSLNITLPMANDLKTLKIHNYNLCIVFLYKCINIWYICGINLLWPGDAIWRRGSGSALAQVMACCLTTPRYYLNHCWLITNADLSSIGCVGIHTGTLSHEVFMLTACGVSLKIKLPWTNELKPIKIYNYNVYPEWNWSVCSALKMN